MSKIVIALICIFLTSTLFCGCIDLKLFHTTNDDSTDHSTHPNQSGVDKEILIWGIPEETSTNIQSIFNTNNIPTQYVSTTELLNHELTFGTYKVLLLYGCTSWGGDPRIPIDIQNKIKELVSTGEIGLIGFHDIIWSLGGYDDSQNTVLEEVFGGSVNSRFFNQTFQIVDRSHPLSQGVPTTFTAPISEGIAGTWDQHAHIIATIQNNPAIVAHEYQNGRTVWFVNGHNGEGFDDKNIQQLMVNAYYWVQGTGIVPTKQGANSTNNLRASISPTTVTMDVGQSQLFTSITLNGTWPFTFQWYLNGDPQPGATDGTWTFTPTSSGSYAVYVNVTDSAGATNTSNTVQCLVYCQVEFSETDLPVGASWSVSFNSASFPYQTKSSTSNSITFSVPDGNYYFSVAPPVGYIVPPDQAIGAVTVNGENINMPTVTFSLNPIEMDTAWNDVKDSYNFSNPRSPWGDARGVCYGMTSTAVMYFMRNTLRYTSYPWFPSQSPAAASTSDLKIILRYNVPIFGSYFDTLNNASLALMFNHVYFYNYFNPSGWFPVEWKNRQLINLFENMTFLQPVVLNLGRIEPLVPNKDRGWFHSVVAVGTKPETFNGIPTGIVDIYIYDPNHPQTRQTATYDTNTGNFLYKDPDVKYLPPEIPGVINGTYNLFYVVNPPDMLPHEGVTPENYTGVWSEEPHWLKGSVTGYYIVIADKPVTVTANNNGQTDKFGTWGDSRTFIQGIPNSSGIEEGNVQVYAIPSDIDIAISDPSLGQSGLLITRVANESGQPVGYGYLVNAATTQGSLNFIVIPSSSGLSIISRNETFNTSVTFFYATQQGYSIYQSSVIPVSPMQKLNFTVTNWQMLNSTSPSPVILTSNRTNIPPTTPKLIPGFELIIAVCAIALVLLWKRKRI